MIENVPVAAPCYPGALHSAATCETIQAQWNNSVFQSEFPIGYSYPATQSCDIPGGNTTTCSIGDSPVYAVNVSKAEHVVAGINYAREHNLRLAIKMTGHDLIGRSTGYGSLEIWLRHLQNGITFEEVYRPTNSCAATMWTGGAMKIEGGYRWADVYPLARANKVVVVGGGCPVSVPYRCNFLC